MLSDIFKALDGRQSEHVLQTLRLAVVSNWNEEARTAYINGDSLAWFTTMARNFLVSPTVLATVTNCLFPKGQQITHHASTAVASGRLPRLRWIKKTGGKPIKRYIGKEMKALVEGGEALSRFVGYLEERPLQLALKEDSRGSEDEADNPVVAAEAEQPHDDVMDEDGVDAVAAPAAPVRDDEDDAVVAAAPPSPPPPEAAEQHSEGGRRRSYRLANEHVPTPRKKRPRRAMEDHISRVGGGHKKQKR
jgi:hypothetical protein